jgi:quinolinate synthase
MQPINEKIKQLKEKHNVLILAHYYQPDAVQEIADMVGDSYGLAKESAETDADVILFCGVEFMAESAKILNPSKTVLLPEMKAGCPMADMATAQDVRDLKEKYPDAAFICYVNTTAEVKAECDVCVTSSNAVKIVNALEEDQVVFLPDKNLANYVATKCDKEVIPYAGYCLVHNRILPEEVQRVKDEHPGVPFLVHPECTKEVLALADFIGSTAQILNYATQSESKQFIIGTERGILYKLKEQNPDKEFFIASERFTCANMKKNTLAKTLKCLEDFDQGISQNIIELDEQIMAKAKKSLDKMLEIGG